MTTMSNKFSVCPEEHFKVQISLRKGNNYNRNWTNSAKFFEIWEKFHGVWVKPLWQRFLNRIFHFHMFFLRKLYFWGKHLYFKHLLDFNEKNSIPRVQMFFHREILFFSHLMAKLRHKSELRLVEKLTFDWKSWEWNSIFIICSPKTYQKTSSRHLKMNVRQIWAST